MAEKQDDLARAHEALQAAREGLAPELQAALDAEDKPAKKKAEPEVVEEVIYEDMTVAELRDELAARDMQVSGAKNDLIKRLDKDDRRAAKAAEKAN